MGLLGVLVRRLLPILLFAPTAPALADGGFFGKMGVRERVPVSAPGQKAVILRDGPAEVLLLQTTYRGPANQFAWVVPVPSRPARDDVFLANPEFLEEADYLTRSRVRTDIQDPLDARTVGLRTQSTYGNVRAAFPAPGGLGGGGAAVIVHDRMDVGDYDVSVLSATGPGVLSTWLVRHGYAFPREAGPVADGYVARGWKFVAMRIRPAVRRQQAMLTDVAPVGIRFAAERLVYPLAISRVSAAERTTLLLVVLAGAGVECRELPTLRFPAETKAPRGTTYTALARELLARQGGRALLCEAKVQTESPYLLEIPVRQPPRPPRRLTTQEIERDRRALPGMWAGPDNSPDGTWPAPMGRSGVEMPAQVVATRLWAELPREAMVDLSFAPSGDPPFGLEIVQAARLSAPLWTHLFGMRWARISWIVLAFGLALAALWPRPAPQVGKDAMDALRTACLISTGMIVVGSLSGIFFTSHGWLLRNLRLGMPGGDLAPLASLARVLLALLTVPSAFLLPRLTRRLPPGAAAQGLPWLGVLVVPPLAVCWGLFLSEAGSGGSSAAIIGLNAFAVAGVAGLCWPLALGLVASDSHRDRDARVMRAFVVSILSLVVLVPVVHWLCNVALSRQPGAYAVQREQQEQAERIAKALRQFRDATGAYPAKLEDLTAARMPTQGLDTSGNPVPILAGQALSMPQLPALPVDPLTGRSDTWVYNPRSPLLVESGGYEVTVITVMGDR